MARLCSRIFKPVRLLQPFAAFLCSALPSRFCSLSCPYRLGILALHYRAYHNSDPPGLHQLWHQSRLGKNAAEGFGCDIFELFAISPVYFERDGLIVAEDDAGRLVGFVHASFAVNETETALDYRQGILSALVVHPEYRRRGIGRALVERAEQYLRGRGAVAVEAGGGLNRNGFYCGIYGGMEASGFCSEAMAGRDFFAACGYGPGMETCVLRRDLQRSRDPVHVRLMRHRRLLQMTISDRPEGESWWWFCRFGQMESMRIALHSRETGELVAAGQLVGMDLFIPKWGVRSVGLRKILVPEPLRRFGYAQFLVLELCRRLREEHVQLVEAQVGVENSAALELFTSSKFELHGRLQTFRKRF